MINSDFSWISGLLFLGGSVIIDIDVIFSMFIEEKNHRYYITHSFLFWVILIIIFLILRFTLTIFFDYFLYLIIGIIWHLLLDLIDWGLPILPSKKVSRIYLGFLKEDANIEKNSSYFLKTYWSNKLILSIELLLFASSLLGWFFVPYELLIGVGIICFLVYLFFVYEMLKLTKKKTVV